MSSEVTHYDASGVRVITSRVVFPSANYVTRHVTSVEFVVDTEPALGSYVVMAVGAALFFYGAFTGTLWGFSGVVAILGAQLRLLRQRTRRGYGVRITHAWRLEDRIRGAGPRPRRGGGGGGAPGHRLAHGPTGAAAERGPPPPALALRHVEREQSARPGAQSEGKRHGQPDGEQRGGQLRGHGSSRPQDVGHRRRHRRPHHDDKQE